MVCMAMLRDLPLRAKLQELPLRAKLQELPLRANLSMRVLCVANLALMLRNLHSKSSGSTRADAVQINRSPQQVSHLPAKCQQPLGQIFPLLGKALRWHRN
jgi:hypothetical protein